MCVYMLVYGMTGGRWRTPRQRNHKNERKRKSNQITDQRWIIRKKQTIIFRVVWKSYYIFLFFFLTNTKVGISICFLLLKPNKDEKKKKQKQKWYWYLLYDNFEQFLRGKCLLFSSHQLTFKLKKLADLFDDNVAQNAKSQNNIFNNFWIKCHLICKITSRNWSI